MTEATTTEETESRYTKDELKALSIPWFLDAKNPDNIRRREEHRARYVDPWSNFSRNKTVATKRSSIPAKEGTEVEAAATPVTNTIRSKPGASQVIRIIAELKHKAGSKAEAKSAGIRDGMTVAEYKANSLGFTGNWQTSYLKYLVDKKLIKLEG